MPLDIWLQYKLVITAVADSAATAKEAIMYTVEATVHCSSFMLLLQEYVDLSAADSYLVAAGAQALVSSKAGRAAKVHHFCTGLVDARSNCRLQLPFRRTCDVLHLRFSSLVSGLRLLSP